MSWGRLATCLESGKNMAGWQPAPRHCFPEKQKAAATSPSTSLGSFVLFGRRLVVGGRHFARGRLIGDRFAGDGLVGHRLDGQRLWDNRLADSRGTAAGSCSTAGVSWTAAASGCRLCGGWGFVVGGLDRLVLIELHQVAERPQRLLALLHRVGDRNHRLRRLTWLLYRMILFARRPATTLRPRRATFAAGTRRTLLTLGTRWTLAFGTRRPASLLAGRTRRTLLTGGARWTLLLWPILTLRADRPRPPAYRPKVSRRRASARAADTSAAPNRDEPLSATRAAAPCRSP